MLSLILSWLFRIAFVFTLFAGCVECYIQATQKPIILSKNSIGTSAYGAPGLAFKASTSGTGREALAPDTTVYFKDYKQGNTIARNSGSLKLNGLVSKDYIKRYDSVFKSWKLDGDSLVLDTQVTLLVNRKNESDIPDMGTETTSWDTLGDARVVIHRNLLDEKGKETASFHDTFPDARVASLVAITGNIPQKQVLLQEGFREETIRIKPNGTKQLILFALYELLCYVFSAMFLLTLANLFRNFYRKQYFTLPNVRLLTYAGISLLAVQLLHIIIYWGLLFHLSPVRVVINNVGHADLTATYQLRSSNDNSYIFLGVGLLVLSIIFRNGLRITKENSMFI